MDIMHEDRVIIQSLYPGWYQFRVHTLDMLRLDLVHPVVSGNKWYKLRLNIMQARDHGFKTILTFGGGYSNHLIATAYTAKHSGLRSVGIVRGKYPVLTPTLRDCVEEGMELIFVTKEDYDRQGEPEWEQKLAAQFDSLYIVPEGGANEWGRKGAGLISKFIKPHYTHILLSVGSGTTLCGIRNKTNPQQQVMGFAPMKQGAYLADHIAPHLDNEHKDNWTLYDNWHFGGFGKWNNELIEFMNDFHAVNNIPLDIIYTSKMMYGLRDLINTNHFSETDKLLCIHTGGLQGNVSVQGLVY
jgi:1-aminocyclopropane-1-carboxylate deaminase